MQRAVITMSEIWNVGLRGNGFQCLARSTLGESLCISGWVEAMEESEQSWRRECRSDERAKCGQEGYLKK